MNGKGKIVCPFHAWEFSADGSVHDVPYLKGDAETRRRCLLSTSRGLKIYPAQDFMGVVVVWHFCRADISPTSRGAAAAVTWIFQGTSRGDVDIQWRQVVVTPRPSPRNIQLVAAASPRQSL